MKGILRDPHFQDFRLRLFSVGSTPSDLGWNTRLLREVLGRSLTQTRLMFQSYAKIGPHWAEF